MAFGSDRPRVNLAIIHDLLAEVDRLMDDGDVENAKKLLRMVGQMNDQATPTAHTAAAAETDGPEPGGSPHDGKDDPGR